MDVAKSIIDLSAIVPACSKSTGKDSNNNTIVVIFSILKPCWSKPFNYRQTSKISNHISNWSFCKSPIKCCCKYSSTCWISCQCWKYPMDLTSHGIWFFCRSHKPFISSPWIGFLFISSKRNRWISCRVIALYIPKHEHTTIY